MLLFVWDTYQGYFFFHFNERTNCKGHYVIFVLDFKILYIVTPVKITYMPCMTSLYIQYTLKLAYYFIRLTDVSIGDARSL